MTLRENRLSLVDIISYDFFWPDADGQDAVYGFTHSHEILNICAGMPPPHIVTPVTKDVLEDALADYVERRGIASEDEVKIRAWLAQMPDAIAIIELQP
ncbi:MAG: hypothetical protein F4W95_01510 [Chloroflexi bacterium]|nr:hypothetical protein [Chloroflexota bacterium]MYD47143.1 hypothetical protein [Chloroflexota bacterium]